jgi:phosphate transport system substrate-binding protein
MRRTMQVLFANIVVISLFLSACSAAPAATQSTAMPVETPTTVSGIDFEDPASLSGDIYSAGSSTVGPLSEAVSEQFIADGFPGTIKNDIIGTGGGFERFCKTGESDIANASRKIKDTELANCAALSPARTPLEFQVGIDAIAIVVSQENDFASDVTMKELELLFTTAEKWSDVRPDWPSEPILRYTPGTDSGTFDYFVETVIQKPNKIEKLEEAKALALAATGLEQSEDDNVLVTGVEGSQYAIGYFGVAYYTREADRLNALTVEGLAPSYENAESGAYKLARPLFIYSDAGIMKTKPQVAAFIKYYIENVDSLVEKVGYYPAPDAVLQADLDAWAQAMK